MMRYYADEQGSYLGGWDAIPPAGAIEVPFPPDDARQVWDGVQWGPVPAVVPERVTMRQARLALLGAELLDDVESALSALEGPQGQAARIEWEYSQEVHRGKPFVQMLGAAIGLTEEQIDQLFITASGID